MLSRDSQLQLVRRIDWRFLLPDPRLHHVAYLGPRTGTLVQALREFAGSLTAISTLDSGSTWRCHTSRFDLVVLHSPHARHLEAANSLLAPGGYLYWEVDRTRALRTLARRIYREGWSRRLRFPDVSESLTRPDTQHYRQALHRLGVSNVQAYWHRPSFEACLEIIPLDEPLTLNYVFDRASGRRTAWLVSVAGRWLAQTGWLGRLVPCLSLTAHKQGG